MKKFGVCLLTKEEGKFVKSHIIPQAFIQKSKKDEPFILPMGKGRSKKYWTGWYDPEIVIQKGEDIL